MNFVDAMETKDMTTQNDMPTHSTSGSDFVDMFFKMGGSRGMSKQEIERLLIKAFSDMPLETVKAIFYNRDIRGGQGERRSFRIFYRYLAENYSEIARKNIPNVPEFGRWDDFISVANTPIEEDVLDFIADALKDGNSLCAKWMPREGKANDFFAKKLMKHMDLTPKQYRKMLVSLTDVVENKMCENDWEEINYNHVPSVASNKYRKAFFRNDGDRYEAWVNSLEDENSDSKVNADAIFPHDIVKPLLKGYGGYDRNGTDTKMLEAQWKALPNYMGEDTNKILPVCDVSGSMLNPDRIPMAVSVSLGLYISERNIGPFQDVFMTFSAQPKLQRLTSDRLSERVVELESAEWEMNTDIERMFDLVLNQARKHNLTEEEMPEMLLIISDMQFDRCIQDPSDTAMEMIRRKYSTAGYELPKIVFWNVDSKGGVPVKFTESGVALVSGFSPSILKMILSNDRNLNPLSLALDTVNDDRYESVII